MGLCDSKLSEKLQLDPKLTLDSGVMSARQSESVHRQQSDLRKDDDRKLQKHPSGHKRGDLSTQRKSGPPRKAPQQSKCTRCGLNPSHDIKSCPAKDCVCRGCGKRGHYQRVCKTVKVSNIERETEEDSGLLLGAVTERDSQPWTVKILVNNEEIEFCINTGAEVTAISECTHCLIGSPEL